MSKMLRLPRNLHFEVHKVLRCRKSALRVLCLSRNLRFQVHKVLRLLGTLHLKVHKLLHLT